MNIEIFPAPQTTPSRPHAALQRGPLAVAAAALVALSLITGCKTKTAAPPSDQQLTSAIQSRIQGESALNGQNIQVSVSNGIATLNGTVIDNASRALAANDSGTVPGVKTVINNLTVQPQQATPAAAPAPMPQPARENRPVHRSREQQASSRRYSQPSQRQQAYTPPQQYPPQQYSSQQPSQYPPPQPMQQPMQQSAPAPPPQPVAQKVTLPVGTAIPVILTEALDTKTTQTNDVFHATLARDLMVNGVVAIHKGAPILGQVVDSKEAAHFKGQAFLSLDLTQVSVYGKKIDLQTDTFNKQGKARGRNTAEKTGGGALLGALIGGLAGGGKGAAIGAIAGGGAGAGVNAITRGEEVQIPSESHLDFHLQAPITLTVKPEPPGAPVNPEPTLQQR